MNALTSRLNLKNQRRIGAANKSKADSRSGADWTLPPPQPGKQEQMYHHEADVLFVGGAAGSGKANRCAKLGYAIRHGVELSSVPDVVAGLDTKVLRWDGKWIDFSDLTVGEKIMNPDGQYQEVLQIQDRGMMQFYLLTFEDGTSVEATEDHLWSFWEARCNSRRKTCNGENFVYSNLDPRGWNKNYITRARVRDTKWLINETKKGRRFIFPINAPLQFTARSFRDNERAYVYGAMIGDGHFGEERGGSFILTTTDDFIAEKVKEIAGEGAAQKTIPPVQDGYLPITQVHLTRVPWFKAWVHNNRYRGVRCWDKEFSEGYLSAPLEFRYNLAQGLFDTDGTVGDVGKREVSYTTTSPRLAEQVSDLVRSLGYMARIGSRTPCYTHCGEKREGKLAYTVFVQGNHLELLFSLPRKREKALAHGQFNGGNSWPGKGLVSIEPTDVDFARCIVVSNPNRLYVCDGYNTTHNSLFLLLDSAKQKYIKSIGYNCVIFRKSYPELTNPGGLVDESKNLYRNIGGRFVSKPPTWRWEKYNSQIAFRHIRHEDTVYEYQGAQFARIGFDELCHFSEESFFYMLSRNRSGCGVKPQVRATMNPDADSWVANFIQWWWNPETGYPIPERSGVTRYFVRLNNQVHWDDTKEALIEEHYDSLAPVVEASNGLVTFDDMVKSFSFIAASIFDNPALLRVNPQYLSNLNSLEEVEKQRLLFGNWKIRHDAGIVFDRNWFQIIDYEELPREPLIKIRFWDLAATAREDAGSDSCSTAGCLMGMIGTNIYIFDLQVMQVKGGEVIGPIRGCAIADGVRTKIRFELEGGASGKIVEESFAKEIEKLDVRYDVKAIKPDKSKLQRALPLATQARLGYVFLIRGDWNGEFLSAVESFDGMRRPRVNDIVDAATGAFEQVTNPRNTIIVDGDAPLVGYSSGTVKTNHSVYL
jgi:predicted phage terminase large subunit-like protein